MTTIVRLLAQFLAVMLVITFHEFAHAFTAYKCGDPTAKYSGRMTLNPFKHFDPLGIVMFAIVGFGWAKPVPINPYNFKNYKKGCLLTSSAGVIVNYLMAFIVYPLWLLVWIYVLPLEAINGTYAQIFLRQFFSCTYIYSLSFCVFNLLPFYPLDGFRIVDALSDKQGKVYQFLRKYGYYILMGLILISFLANRIPYLAYIDVLGYVLQYVVDIIGKPITTLWNFLFKPIM